MYYYRVITERIDKFVGDINNNRLVLIYWCLHLDSGLTM